MVSTAWAVDIVHHLRILEVDDKVRTDPTYPAGFMGKFSRFGTINVGENAHFYLSRRHHD